jgi:hypothetical protein
MTKFSTAASPNDESKDTVPQNRRNATSSHQTEESRSDVNLAGGELKQACEHIVRELMDGVRHGFSEMTVKVETMQSKKKSVTIVAGKSYRFIV